MNEKEIKKAIEAELKMLDKKIADAEKQVEDLESRMDVVGENKDKAIAELKQKQLRR